jgi:glycine/serine hydroxymethyltransferase
MGAAEMTKIADWMDRVAKHATDDAALAAIAAEVKAECDRFPAPGIAR